MMPDMAAAAIASALRAPPPLALLVDRNSDTRRMYAEFLTYAPYEIDEAEDGREALAKALTRHPDIIVTETRLPGMNGFELCDLLRRDSATQDIRILFVTADAYESDVRHAEQSGADAVLVKPCLPETLLFEIRRLLAESPDALQRGRALHDRLLERLPQSERLPERARRHTLSRAHARAQTTEPPAAPPPLMCPKCDRPLHYQRSHLGGVNAHHPEQWDYFECAAGCGTFQYRQRTRKLRQVN
jgi:CheY-like chemotaxis protein